MNYLIDGHNLIGSNLFPDIRLSDEDDEAKLVMRLKIWQSRILKNSKSTMTVIFDRGLPGGKDVKMGGVGVEVIFATNPAQADDLIRRRLQKAKQGLILVTNDDALHREAAVYGVTTWRGDEFVNRMKPKIPDRAEAGTESDVQLSKEEVDEWLMLFGASRPKKKARTPEGVTKPPEKKGQVDGTNQLNDGGRSTGKGDEKNSRGSKDKKSRTSDGKGGSKREDKR